MKRNMHVIQISGIKGILLAIFVVTCLAAGFIAFPAIIAMSLWNYATNYIAIPTINIWQGLMLWGIVAMTGFIINSRKKYLVAFTPKTQLSEDELNKVMERIRFQAQAKALNSMILNSKEIQQNSEEEKEKENM